MDEQTQVPFEEPTLPAEASSAVQPSQEMEVEMAVPPAPEAAHH